MDKFVPSIKKKYRDRLINYGKNWPPCHSDKLVRLELVQKEKGEGYSINTQRNYEGKSVEQTPLAYGDLFKVEDGKQPVRKVLVEGDAGIGKTTLSISISEGWACETLFRNFDLLLLLPLRHKEVASASSLSDLLKLLHPSSGICKSVATYLEEDEGEKVLIIADGWDELVESKRSEESFLFHLLFERFPLMSVVVTSRHFASASFHSLSCIDRYAEIRGFHKEDIREYIQSEFLNNQEKACHLLEQLEGNPLVESVCSVPLNCAIICHLWHTLDETFPSTMTELYTKVVLNIILRDIQKNDEYKSILKLSNFNALPEDLRQSFWHLCRFAFEALKKGVIVFAEEELTEFFPQGLEKIHCFGLLQSAVTVLETGLGVSFHFLHLTFMEYLAALHLAKLPRCAQHEMLEVRSQKVNKSSHLAITWRFFFGIYFSDSNVNTEDVKWAINSCVTGSSSKALALCQCAFEAKSDVINREVVSIIDTKTVYPYNSYDSAAALYVIANMEKCSDIVMEFTSGRIMAKQVRTLTDTLVNKQGKLQFKELNLRDNKLNDECVSDLFHRASTAFQSVAKVSLRGNRIGANAMKTISKTLAFSSKACELCSLDLSCNALGVSGLQALIDSVRTQLFCNLKVLRIEETLTGSDTDANASLLSTLIESVSTHCPSLQHVYLSQNNLGVPGASAMARVMVRLLRHSPLTLIQHSEGKAVLSKIYVQKPQFLSFLSLGRTGLGDIGLHVFVNSLRVVRLYVLQWLDLRGNDIHAFGMSCLAEAVCSGKVVITNLLGESNVDLDGNPLGLEGCVLVCRMLGSRHFKPHTLSLSDCQLTTAGAGLLGTGSFNVNDSTLCEAQRHVCQQLCRYSQNCCITCLSLSGSSFTGEGVGILAGFMYLCVSLRQLYTRGCGIDSDDIKQLLDKLLQLKHSSPNICTMLESWILSDNKIDDAGVSQLIDQLPTLFPRLGCGISGCILFGNNSASKEMQIRLEKEWNKRVKKPHSIVFLIPHPPDPSERLGVFQTARLINPESFASQSKDKQEDTAEPALGPTIRTSRLEPQASSRECHPSASESPIAPQDNDEVKDVQHVNGHTTDSCSTTTPVTERFKHEHAKVTGEVGNENLKDKECSVVSTSQEVNSAENHEQLDQVLDSRHDGVSKHLGQIAETMYEWEGLVAEQLSLTPADVAAIKMKYPNQLKLQTRAALEKWKQKLGSKATYRNLIVVFQHAGYRGYADTARNIITGTPSTSLLGGATQSSLQEPTVTTSADASSSPTSTEACVHDDI